LFIYVFQNFKMFFITHVLKIVICKNNIDNRLKNTIISIKKVQ